MPKIKAYTNQGLIIPVSEAKISTVYQCPWTHNVFGTKNAYIKHLGVLRENRMHRRARDLAKTKRMQELWSLPTFDDIVSWIGNNPKIVLDNVFDDKKKNYNTFSIKITYLDLRWSNSVSNSHCCPHNGVTNWGRRDVFRDGTPKPSGYPGWQGRIEYKTNRDVGFGSDVLGNFRIHTGTGGGMGHGRYGFEVKFFDADWPGLHAYQNLAARYETFKYGTPAYFK